VTVRIAREEKREERNGQAAYCRGEKNPVPWEVRQNIERQSGRTQREPLDKIDQLGKGNRTATGDKADGASEQDQ
jgi:hypothetical protein